MKIKTLFFGILTLFVFTSQLAFAQLSDEKWDLMLIREDKVYPSMTDDYEMSLMDLKVILENKNIKSFNYFTHMQDDYCFTHVTPIKHLKDLSNGMHSHVAKKLNDPEFDLILDYLNEATESYRYYIVKYHPEFSYLPEGDDWGTGNSYRKWNYYYFQPGTEDDVEEVLAAWKQLYETKGVKTGFRVFSGFIGVEQPLYMLTTWAENPLDYHTKLQSTATLLGDDGIALYAKMLEFVNEAVTVEGWFLPQYSYAPGLKMAE